MSGDICSRGVSNTECDMISVVISFRRVIYAFVACVGLVLMLVCYYV